MEYLMTAKNLVLRTVYIDPEVDDKLRNEAFARRTSKNDLFRNYLRLGMQKALEDGSSTTTVVRTQQKPKTQANPAAKSAVVRKLRESAGSRVKS
jgi:hypothetical protein